MLTCQVHLGGRRSERELAEPSVSRRFHMQGALCTPAAVLTVLLSGRPVVEGRPVAGRAPRGSVLKLRCWENSRLVERGGPGVGRF